MGGIIKKLILILVSIVSFTFSILASPILVLPPNQQNNVSITPMLAWNAIEGASFYEIQISTAPDISSLIEANIPMIVETHFQVPSGAGQGRLPLG